MTDIKFFEQVFEPDLCHFFLNNARQCLASSDCFRRSNSHWDPDLVLSSEPVLVRDYETDLAQIILEELNKGGLIDHDDYSVMNYAWGRLSFIPWHRDPQSETAVTIYLNEIWDADWGGLFLYKPQGGEEIRGFAPRFNCAIRNNQNLDHATSLIAVDAKEPRFTIQLFSRRKASAAET